MAKLGYAVSSEEVHPRDAVRHVQRAEALGFSFALISDHFHPWVDQQGHSPFVWNIIGAIAMATERIHLGTGVTCPIIRIHPAILAQAAATSAAMMPGRFFFGIGTGEKLNEHVLGDRWPAFERRAEMFREAVHIIRTLWRGEDTTYYGQFYTVETARLYTLPDEPPPLMIAASGPKAATMAGQIGDGFISTAPDAELVTRFEEGGEGRPKYGKLTVCYHPDEAQAKALAHQWWPTAALGGELSQELPTPAHFEQAAKNVTPDDVAEAVLCSADPEAHKARIQEFVDAGFDHVYVHQVGPEQDGFFDFYEKHILPDYV